jgi:hypothetical protein
MALSTYAIAVGHCYILRDQSGRRILAKVTKMVEDEIKAPVGDDPAVALTIEKVQFQWRNLSQTSQWSAAFEWLLPADFARQAVEEVACD